MKIQNLLTQSVAVLCLTLSMTHNVSAAPVTIMDNYYGATGNGNGDIVGNSNFEVSSLEVERIGTNLFVTINTAFVNHQGSFTANTDGASQGSGLGIGLGDLFLTADAWTPDGNAGNHYVTDDASNGTNWTYGFSLDDRWNATDQSVNDGKLYELTSMDNDINSFLSDDFISASPSSYRAGQEISVDTSSAMVLDTLNTGTWEINQGANTLSFMFDVSGTDLATSDNIAFHWGMTCGNDVIEGNASLVPAPFAIWMIGVGLIGLARFKKYKV